MSYDIKFRKRAIEYLKEGHTYRETSKVFGISPNTLLTWVRKLKKTGDLQDPKRNASPRKIDPVELGKYLSEHPDAYQSEIAEHFNCKQPSVSLFLKKSGYTRKKRPNVTKNKTKRK